MEKLPEVIEEVYGLPVAIGEVAGLQKINF